MQTNVSGPILRSSADVAREVGGRVNAILTLRGLDLTWLAGAVGLNVSTLVTQFSEELNMAILIDVADELGVSWASLLEEAA